eukprot:scaffold83576_cov79-Cyclotella_meneghiniana.AAC.1
MQYWNFELGNLYTMYAALREEHHSFPSTIVNGEASRSFSYADRSVHDEEINGASWTNQGPHQHP